MSEKINSEMISRRGTFSLLGLAAAWGLALPAEILTESDAEAQQTTSPTAPTTGAQRRQERRTHRTERRQERRTHRTERRQERRTHRTERRAKRRGGGEATQQK
jgi:hypothetical protein